MVELLVGVTQVVVCHDLKVEDEHDHNTILVLHRDHVHITLETLTCGHTWREKGCQTGMEIIDKSFVVHNLVD